MNLSNLYSLNYREEAQTLQPLPFAITDAHIHLTGLRALELFSEAASLFKVNRFLSMTPLEDVESVQRVLGDAVAFNTVPKFFGSDPLFEHGPGYTARIKQYYGLGARVAKFWCAPRIYDLIQAPFTSHPLRIDSPVRRSTIDVAVELGMKLMVHIGDPDTWFATRYRDASRYGTKRQQYEMLEWLLDTYKVPTIAAHMGGSPEDLDFLDDLLARHHTLFIDTSAMKWQVRELSKHAPERRRNFFKRWHGRVLFGSDIVTSEQHLLTAEGKSEMNAKASSEQEAFDLYASRYYCARKLFEYEVQLDSPVADPDLHMVDATQSPTASPKLVGAQLDHEELEMLYHGAFERFINL